MGLKQLSSTLILAVAASLGACGGGGDDSVSFEQLNGTYAVSMSKSGDNCGVYPAYNGADHNVAVGGREVTVSFNGTYLFGSANDSGGLSAGKSETIGSATSTLSLVYQPTSTPNVYNVTLTGKAASGNAVCSVTYSGTATKR